jgi:hypothetical protein
VEEFLLALLAFAKELDIINNQHINRTELLLEACKIALLDCGDEPVDEFLATKELNEHFGVVLFCFTADGVEQVCFAEARAAVKKQRIVCGARRTADGNATGVCEAIAGADDKIGKGVIGMQFQFAVQTLMMRRF